jgi:hypothetical protein
MNPNPVRIAADKNVDAVSMSMLKLYSI